MASCHLELAKGYTPTSSTLFSRSGNKVSFLEAHQPFGEISLEAAQLPLCPVAAVEVRSGAATAIDVEQATDHVVPFVKDGQKALGAIDPLCKEVPGKT